MPDDARQLDAEVAEMLGWTDIRPEFEGVDGIGFGIPPSGRTGMLIPHYSTDASDDYLVLEHVFDKWTPNDQQSFVYRLEKMRQSRIAQTNRKNQSFAFSRRHGELFYRIGDYSRAALDAVASEKGDERILPAAWFHQWWKDGEAKLKARQEQEADGSKDT